MICPQKKWASVCVESDGLSVCCMHLWVDDGMEYDGILFQHDRMRKPAVMCPSFALMYSCGSA